MKYHIISDKEGVYWLANEDGIKIGYMGYEDIQDLSESCSFALLDYETQYKGEHGVADWFKKKEG